MLENTNAAVGPKLRQPKHISVRDFYERHHKELGLRLLGSDAGFARLISEPTVNRPGLALAGFYAYFARKRIQVIGNQEFAYLESLSGAEQVARFAELCAHDFPCLIICRDIQLSAALLEVVEKERVAIFSTRTRTMKFINAATIVLEREFAPSVSAHGSMVDVRGIGVLIRGASGTGKSETVLGLIERGHSLVADDLVHLRTLEGREVVGSAPEMGRYYMEVRGLGIINIPALYGIASMRLEKRLDLVVSLMVDVDINEFERVGNEPKFHNILGIEVPLVELPVLPGRDMSLLVEVAALDQKLRSFGHNSAVEFNKNLLKLMQKKHIS
ncbi:MAG: HPr(Ser) kinase/phosphatase [Verrucomicrobiales bacterium]